MEKSIFNFKILYEDGELIDLHEDLKLWVSSFHIPSPDFVHVTESIDGRNGEIILETTLKGRPVKASFLAESVNPIEFDKHRDKLFRVFNPLKEFYIIRDLQPGKRLKVRVNTILDIDYLTPEDGEFTLEFLICSVFIESTGTTLNPEWGFQVKTNENVQYKHSTQYFSIWNDGDILVDPREHFLKVLFNGPSVNLNIRNLTTGDIWGYTGNTAAGDSVELNGIRSLKNGSSIFGQTNKKLITLAPGMNEFEITGAVDPFEISFDFSFLYL
ncbi:phage tail domain-containing protein [Cytobacillus firmus]|uniref:phage tail domain-containing protein n=1 Tax=Cytobacillus firmus TaxID=1399 RepID=UPI0018CEB7E9|nr:phage tail domain-containing protein [Cytobacillus firmus]MBG9586918.1 hypothetical protein [Cytobacillus firmus]